MYTYTYGNIIWNIRGSSYKHRDDHNNHETNGAIVFRCFRGNKRSHVLWEAPAAFAAVRFSAWIVRLKWFVGGISASMSHLGANKLNNGPTDRRVHPLEPPMVIGLPRFDQKTVIRLKRCPNLWHDHLCWWYPIVLTSPPSHPYCHRHHQLVATRSASNESPVAILESVENPLENKYHLQYHAWGKWRSSGEWWE
jgi:hypothetical protein